MESSGRMSTPQFRYNHSVKGLARYRRYMERHPDRVKASHHKHALSGHRREYYHRIQDEAGCHCHIDVFSPGFRLLQGLADASVVEI